MSIRVALAALYMTLKIFTWNNSIITQQQGRSADQQGPGWLSPMRRIERLTFVWTVCFNFYGPPVPHFILTHTLQKTVPPFYCHHPRYSPQRFPRVLSYIPSSVALHKACPSPGTTLCNAKPSSSPIPQEEAGLLQEQQGTNTPSTAAYHNSLFVQSTAYGCQTQMFV